MRPALGVRQDRREHDQAGERNEEPARPAEVGDLVEGVDQPGRQRAGKREAARVEQQHREADEQDARKRAEREPQRAAAAGGSP